MFQGLYPALKFKNNKPVAEFKKVMEEIGEVGEMCIRLAEARQNEKKHYVKELALEIIDAQTALETMLLTLELTQEEINTLKYKVYRKNKDRGYLTCRENFG